MLKAWFALFYPFLRVDDISTTPNTTSFIRIFDNTTPLSWWSSWMSWTHISETASIANANLYLENQCVRVDGFGAMDARHYRLIGHANEVPKVDAMCLICTWNATDFA